MEISIVIPSFNEEKSIQVLYDSLKKMLLKNRDLISDYEIIFVNDGSTDRTVDRILGIDDAFVKLISFDENKGKSAALAKGFMAVEYGVIVTLDSDLQDDPDEIPILLKKLDAGFDCVCGWRYEKASGIIKNASSLIANYIRVKFLKDGIHDSSSPMKAIRIKAVNNMFFFRGFHRFIPYLVMDQGFAVCEVKVKQYPRQYGKSKYNTFGRLIKTVCDLLVLIWLKKNQIKIDDQQSAMLPF